MKILVFSLGPVFKNNVHGGSQKVLRELSILLSRRGHKITILCTKRRDNFKEFSLYNNVRVKPILPFKQTFPVPYLTSPNNLLQISIMLFGEIKKHDILYIHDGGLNLEYLKNIIPTVVSLRDYFYPETLLGAFNFNESELIVNSTHTYNSLLNTVGIFKSEIIDRVHLVMNGYDSNRLSKKRNLSRIKSFLGVGNKLNENKIICFPHRPDPAKGIFESLEIMKKLLLVYPNAKLLVPRYIDLKVSKEPEQIYTDIGRYIKQNKLIDKVILHEWVPYDLMPEYYSLSDVTLCVGNFVESFSNVAVESLLCGTPVIASKVATFRSMPVAKFINQVDYGNLELATKEILKLIKNDKNNQVTITARNFIKKNLSLDKMCDQYENIFKNAKIRKTLKVKMDIKLKNNTFLNISPWCHISDRNGRIYDDYQKSYFYFPRLVSFFKNSKLPVSIKSFTKNGFSSKEVLNFISKGVLIISKE